MFPDDECVQSQVERSRLSNWVLEQMASRLELIDDFASQTSKGQFALAPAAFSALALINPFTERLAPRLDRHLDV